jgi:hypothetical protein
LTGPRDQSREGETAHGPLGADQRDTDPAEEARLEFEAALERVLVRMKSEGRIATEQERDRLRELHRDWKLYAPLFNLFEEDEIPDWEAIDSTITSLPARRSPRRSAAHQKSGAPNDLTR